MSHVAALPPRSARLQRADTLRWWRNPKLRGNLYQIVLVAAVAALFFGMAERALSNLAQRGATTGFGFLANEAGFHISEVVAVPRRLHWALALIPIGLAALAWAARARRNDKGSTRNWIAPLRLLGGVFIGIGILGVIAASDWAAYEPSDVYFVAILAGVANTIRVAVIGCILATIFGVALGLCQLSSNWLLRTLAGALTDVFRNVPLLLIAMFWYALLLNAFPAARGAIDIGGILFVTNRGIYYPTITDLAAAVWIPLTVLASVYVGIRQIVGIRSVLDRWVRPRTAAHILVGASLIGLTAGATWDVPRLQGFNFAGGGTVGPEFTALLVGLVLYHGSFIADIVRSGVLSVPSGQWEAGASLGMRRALVLSKIVLPQALRVILPPATLQFLGLTKNTSIGVVIGFPELVSVSRTVLNQSGKAIEVMLIVLASYLVISLAIAACAGMLNERAQIHER